MGHKVLVDTDLVWISPYNSIAKEAKRGPDELLLLLKQATDPKVPVVIDHTLPSLSLIAWTMLLLQDEELSLETLY